jgi:N-acetylglucosamine-6-phosphate deacetylase
MKSFAVAATHLFDGTTLRQDCAVLVEGGRITGVVPASEIPAQLPVERLPEGVWLAPGFVDIQVNGGGDVLFNDRPTVEGIRTIAAAHRRFGTTSLLPTLISDSDDKMRAAADAARKAVESVPGVLGIHFEGPFLSPERAGVHARKWIRKPDPAILDVLAAPPGGVTLVTLAPEEVPAGFIAELTQRGIRVALGHSMATYAETKRAMDEGLTGFTHLFNAMRPLASREPGPIAAALDSENSFYGLIVDGEHVAPPMLRLALRGRGTAMLVSDAMPPVGGTGAGFQLYGQDITTVNGRCATADGTLAGAALDMASAVRNAVRLLGLSLPDALTLATKAPAAFLELAHEVGVLAPGARADMIALQPDSIQVTQTWVGGVTPN